MALQLHRVKKPAYRAAYTVGRGKLLASYMERDFGPRAETAVNYVPIDEKLFFVARGATPEDLDAVVMSKFDDLYAVAMATLGLDADKIIGDYFARQKLYELDLGGQTIVTDGDMSYDENSGLWTLRFLPILEKLNGLRGRIFKEFGRVPDYEDDGKTHMKRSKPDALINRKRSWSCEKQGSVAMSKGLRKKTLGAISRSEALRLAFPPTSFEAGATTTPTGSSGTIPGESQLTPSTSTSSP